MIFEIASEHPVGFEPAAKLTGSFDEIAHALRN